MANRITNEQREAIVRKAVAERDAALSATPAKADERGSAEPVEQTGGVKGWTPLDMHAAQSYEDAQRFAPNLPEPPPTPLPSADQAKLSALWELQARVGDAHENHGRNDERTMKARQEFYEALRAALATAPARDGSEPGLLRAEPQGLKTWGGEPMSSPIEDHHEALLHAGAMLSNCAFNLAQRTPGMALTADDIRALNYSRKAWDAARASAGRANDTE